MKSNPPPDSASFDELWEPAEDEADLPPTLAPSLSGKALGARRAAAPAPEPEEEEESHGNRPTVVPPISPDQYAQAMMELDDPSLAAPKPAAIPSIVRAGATVPRSLGLVMAREHELMMEEPEQPRPRAPLEPFSGAGQPAGRPHAAGRPQAPSSPGPGPRPAVPRPPPPPPLRRRSTGKFPALQSRLPVPRAPSVPPEVEVDVDALEDLESLDALDSFEVGSLPEVPPTPVPPTPVPSTPVPAPRTPAPRRPTPPALSMPASSKPRPGAPVTHGLRLGKRTPTVRPGEPDAAPTSDNAPLSWPGVLVGPPTPRPQSSGPRGRDSGPVVAEAPVSDPAPNSIPERVREMQALFDGRNYSSALVLAESVLLGDPGHAQAKRCAEACREMLTEKYLGNLGGRTNIPKVTMGPEEMRWLSLDHRAGFLLSFIDGSMSIEEVLDVSSMPELDALRIMFELRMQGVIEIVEPARRPGRR